MSFLAPSNASALVSSLLCCTKVHRKVSVASTLALLEASALMSLSEADQQSVLLLYTRRMSKLGVIRNQLKWRAYHQFRSLFLAVIYIYMYVLPNSLLLHPPLAVQLVNLYLGLFPSQPPFWIGDVAALMAAASFAKTTQHPSMIAAMFPSDTAKAR